MVKESTGIALCETASPVIPAVLLLSVLLAAAAASASTWHIEPDGSGDAPTIQAGIDSAAVGDTVELGVGTYTGPENRDIDFLGKSIVVRSEQGDLGAPSTVIDAQFAGRGFLFQNGESLLARLEGVRITHGYADSLGGGILCRNGSSPNIEHCIIDSSTAVFRGGGIDLQGGSSVEMRHCEIAWNHAGENAGGIDCFESSPVIEHCRIHDNTAGDHTGGIVCHTSGASIYGCEIIANQCGLTLILQ